MFNRTNLPHLIRIQLWIIFRELKLECPIWFLHCNIFLPIPFLHVFQNSGVICNLSFVFTFGKASRQWSRESWLSRSLWMVLGQELRQKQIPLKYILLSNLTPLIWGKASTYHISLDKQPIRFASFFSKSLCRSLSQSLGFDLSGKSYFLLSLPIGLGL